MDRQIKLHFLGSGTIMPDPRRSCSAAILETPQARILVDIGAGTLRRMAIEGIDLHSIDYIFITHFHPDHSGDLAPFLFALRNSRPARAGRLLQVWGPAGFFRFVQGLEQAFGKWLQFSHEVKYHELRRRLLDFPGFRLIWSKVQHAPESVAYRFEIENRAVVFSGDTGYCPEIIRLCKKADLAVLECSYPDELVVQGHLSPSLAGKIAAEAGVKKLLLNHFYPEVLKTNPVEVVQKYFTGEIRIANDGDTIAIPLEQERTDNGVDG